MGIDQLDVAETTVEADRPAAASGPRIAYFGGDATNPTLILRINSFLRGGADVSAFTFRRQKFNASFAPNWNNVHLGETKDRSYLARLGRLLWACIVIARRGKAVRDADFIYARMFDAALLGLFARWIFGSKAKFVYEVEDVQEIFFKKTVAGAFFRWAERWILARVDLLVSASPGFLRGYFEPVQNYHGPSFVLENKLQLPRPHRGENAERWRAVRDKWVIGWYGTLRCQRSMELLSEIAARLGDRVEIYTRGYPTETGLKSYLRFVNEHPHWKYEGEYTIPDDLEEMYGRVHFSWCFDFLDKGGNSELLLACRMYQGGYYGAVPLAAAGCEMDRFLSAHRIGHVFAEPIADNVVAFIENLRWDAYERERERILGLGRDVFLDTGEDVQRLFQAVRES